jgi:hypothetical protein
MRQGVRNGTPVATHSQLGVISTVLFSCRNISHNCFVSQFVHNTRWKFGIARVFITRSDLIILAVVAFPDDDGGLVVAELVTASHLTQEL